MNQINSNLVIFVKPLRSLLLTRYTDYIWLSFIKMCFKLALLCCVCRDNEEIREHKDIRITYEDNLAKLEILEVFPEDTGVYRCVATNELGSVECVAVLTVEGDINLYVC